MLNVRCMSVHHKYLKLTTMYSIHHGHMYLTSNTFATECFTQLPEHIKPLVHYYSFLFTVISPWSNSPNSVMMFSTFSLYGHCYIILRHKFQISYWQHLCCLYTFTNLSKNGKIDRYLMNNRISQTTTFEATQEN